MIKKILIVALALCLLVTFGAPVASGAPADSLDVQILESVVDAQGTVVREVAVAGPVTYLYEVNDEYVMCVGISNTGFADISIRYANDDKFFTNIIDLRQYKGIEKAIINGSMPIDAVKNMVLAGQLSLNMVRVGDHQPDSVEIMTADHENRIMSALYAKGWPTAYHGVLRDTMTRDGVLPTSTVLRIASVYLCVSGVYKFATNVHVKKYDVFCYGTKWVSIQGQTHYWAGRTVKWEAPVADLGATLSLKYDNYHWDYFDHVALLDTGIDNYLYYGY